MSREYTTEGGEGRGSPDTQRAAEQYLRAGVMVIPVAAGEKNPNRTGWQKERWAVEDIPRLWNNGQGVGVLWGEPSGGLVDIDLDWPEARVAAKRILPDTRTFGRPGAPESHRVHRVTDKVPKSKKYKLPGKGPGRSVVEVLSTGAQSLVPPSLHDSGERRVWYQERPAVEVDGVAMMEGAADVATAALIARNWPGQGARHDYALAATGYIGRHLSRERAVRVMEAAIAASGDEEAHGRLRDVRGTLDNVAAHRPTTGGPTLDDLAPGVVEQLRRWHGWHGGRGTEYAHQPPHNSTETASFNLTDLGNAERLIARHGDDLRYCYPWAKWLCWDGTRWKPDTSGEVERRARSTVRTIYAEASDGSDKEERKAIANHAERSESRRRIDAMIALARSMVPVAPDDLDAGPWLLNAANGTIDLRTGDLRDHRREDLITKIAAVEYDPDAKAPTFESFLARILPPTPLRGFLQRAVGYAATGVVREEVLPILYGKGANGKTTLTGAFLDALGDYAMQAPKDMLMIKRGEHPTELADLYGKRFVVCMENEEGRRLAESLVKALTGREHIRARRMREDFWEFAPTHTVFLGTNHRPEVRGTDHAIWRRIKEVPFEVVIPDAEQDKKLPEKLREELPGVLAWIVRGCLEYQRDGLQEPDEVKDATKGYKADMDVLAAFFGDRCVIHPKVEVPATPLYKAYQEWCAESGEAQATQTRFGGRLKERGFESFSYTAGPNRDRKGWRGIGLRDDRHDDGPGGSDPPPEQTVTADSSNRSSSAKRDQGAHNTPGSGANPPQRGQSAHNRPHAESSMGMGETREPADSADSCGPKNDIDGLNMHTKSVNPDIGPNYPNRPQSGIVTPRDTRKLAPLVRAVFEEDRRGPAKNLRLYRAGQTTLAILTNSVLGALGVEWGSEGGMDPDERRGWERVVAAAANETIGAERG